MICPRWTPAWFSTTRGWVGFGLIHMFLIPKPIPIVSVGPNQSFIQALSCCLKWEFGLPLAFPFILHLKAQNLCSYRTNQTKPAKHIIIVLSHFNPLAQVSIKVKLAFGCQGRVAGDQDDRGQIVVAPCHLVTCSHGANPAAWFFVLLQLLQLKKGLFESFGIK